MILSIAEVLAVDDPDHALVRAELIANHCLYPYYPDTMRVWTRDHATRQIDVTITRD
ncbi:hypothetical protein KIH74_22610 [Kineosporia sp. J2-2]|uniref:Uncharacterized protein n=1 Tax=Kineosporia corallincola TaxID=2835133 RepID=A0ABS5TKW7_9ACTN|nr:hypothetical protein [Kineosporia corallincola]MBT0771750.1 hypothetical protein [Kineosporia corallincola]